MAKGTNQKLKMLYLAKIFSEHTDDERGLTMPELIERLAAYDVSADRKTLYADLEELRRFGMDIISEQRGHSTFYSLGAREFELPELKLLVDSVQAAKFITDRKSRDLIRKLEGLVSQRQAGQLHRQVLIAGRVKTMNESIYYNIDKLHTAINADQQIRFQYFQWNVRKEMELRHDGQWYQVSPWALMWDDENYYLVAFDAAAGKIKHYRVDKMLRIRLLEERRRGREHFRDFDMGSYARGMFGMFGGEEEDVALEGEGCMVGAVIDRFGKDIPITPLEGGRFRAGVRVVASEQFFAWIVGLGGGVRIVGPERVVAAMREVARRLREEYPD